MDSKLNEDEKDSASNSAASNRTVLNYPGPNPNLKYPLNVVYCGGK